MKIRKNIVFLIMSFFWSISFSIFPLVFPQITQASETQTLSTDEIELAGIEFLWKVLPWERESAKIEVFYDGKEMELPAGRLDLIFKTPGSRLQAGRIPLTLQINVNDKFKKRVRLTSRVLVTQQVIKTSRFIRRGEVINRDDVNIETLETEKPLEKAISNIEKAIGFQAVRSLPKGKILTGVFLKTPVLSSRGNKILIVAQKGGMRISTPGILKEDGYENSMVQVLNIETKKLIYGRLVDANTVKVSF